MKNMPHASVEAYLASRLAGVANTQVDTVFFCGHDDWAGAFYESKVEGVELRASPALRKLLAEGVDPMQETIDFCHGNNMDIFYSFRMNDIHDSFSGNIGPFKQRHPEWLLGRKDTFYPSATSMRTMKEAIWSSLNYNVAAVREHIMQSIEEVAERWKWDGLEFDYGRNASLFPSVFEGHSATDEESAILTEFHRRIRAKTNAMAQERGKPYHLAVVVPETVELARRVGIDIERWLDEGLIDMIIAGNGYVPFSPSSFDMVNLGRKYGVPVYPRINANTGDSDKRAYHKYIELWRACATNAMASGCAGICLFNTYDAPRFHDVPLDIVNEVGDAKELKHRDKMYLADWDFRRCGYGGGDVAFYMPLENLLPMPLAESGRRVEFTCLEDLEGSASDGKSPEIKLRLKVKGLADGEEPSFVFNESHLKDPSVKNTNNDERDLEYKLTPSQVSHGVNTVRVAHQANNTGTTSATLTGVELLFQYPRFPVQSSQ
jgi:hypothetical protein